MSNITDPTNPPRVRPRQSSLMSGIFWPILLFVAVMLYIQWPAVKELYYRASGSQSPESAVPWREDFQAAMTEVRSTDKPMLLVFSAQWCGPCNDMKRSVWSQPEVGEKVTAGYVPMHVDVDDEHLADVTQRYQVHSIPAIFVVDAEGEVLARESYMSPSETLAFLDSNVKP